MDKNPSDLPVTFLYEVSITSLDSGMRKDLPPRKNDHRFYVVADSLTHAMEKARRYPHMAWDTEQIESQITGVRLIAADIPIYTGADALYLP